MTEKRTYTKRRRAESEAETRDRIVEATVALHEEVGPARTTVAAIAERARVHRPTVYRHFPSVETLLGACSTRWGDLHPPPDPGQWTRIPDHEIRTRVALGEIYAYYEATEAMTRHVLRDVDVVPELRVYGARFQEYLAAVVEALLDRRSPDRNGLQRAAIALATSFGTWDTISRQVGLTRAEAVDLGALLVAAAMPAAAR
jgi:AcrR family transcriptional regulator